MTNSVYLEFREEGSAKFWAASLNGPELTTRWGKIDTVGQQKVEVFADEASANASFQKQSEAKVRKGYVQVAPPATNGSEKPTSTKAAKKSKADEVAKPAKPAAPVEVEVETVAAPASPAGKPTPKRSGSTRIFAVESASKSELVAWLKDESRTADELISATGRYTDSDRLIASHVRAPASLLAKLSHSSDRATRARVVANASTPAADYVRLGEQFPKEFLANPLLDLLLLEDPGLLEQLSERLLVQVLRRENCPDDLLVWGAGRDSEKAQLAVAMNGKAPAAAWERLRNSVYPKVLKSLPEAFGSVVDDPEQRFRDAVRERLAALSPEEAHTAWFFRGDIGLAQFSALAIGARVRILGLGKDDPELRRCLASNSRTPRHDLELLTRDPASDVRLAARTSLRKIGVGRESTGTVKAQGTAPVDSAKSLPPIPSLEALAKQRDLGPHGMLVLRRAARSLLTPGVVLEALSTDADKEVRWAIARNPNTPPANLNQMLRQDLETQELRIRQATNFHETPWFQKQLAKAPRDVRTAVERNDNLWFCGKDPNKAVLSRRPLAILLALAAGPFVTPDRIARVVGSTDWLVRAAVARNRGTPPNLLKKLESDANPIVRALAVRPAEPPIPTGSAMLDGLGFNTTRVTAELSALLLGKGLGESVRLRLIEAEDCAPQLWEALSKDASPDVRRSIARHPLVPEALLKELSKDKHNWVRVGVAENPRTPEPLAMDLLAPLTKNKSDIFRQELALLPRLPLALLEVLSQDPDSDVRAGVARNPNAPISLLTVLSKDPSEYVRQHVAESPRSSEEILEQLSKDHSHSVRRAVLSNPMTPIAVLETLSDEREPLIKQIESWAKYKDQAWHWRLMAARNRLAPQSVLATLATDPDWSVRGKVARNPSTPTAIIEVLAKDSEEFVREAVSANTSAPVEVRKERRRELNLRTAMAVGLMGIEGPPYLSESSIPYWLALLTNSPREPDNRALTKASRDKNWLRRLWVALHPNVTEALLQLLAGDEDPDVATAARQTFARRQRDTM
jgi:predicted DNA-binding WGR domain protein